MGLRPGEKLVAEEGNVLSQFAVGSGLLLEGRHLLSICGVCELECIINTASFWADKMQKRRGLDCLFLLVDAGRCEEEVKSGGPGSPIFSKVAFEAERVRVAKERHFFFLLRWLRTSSRTLLTPWLRAVGIHANFWEVEVGTALIAFQGGPGACSPRSNLRFLALFFIFLLNYLATKKPKNRQLSCVERRKDGEKVARKRWSSVASSDPGPLSSANSPFLEQVRDALFFDVPRRSCATVNSRRRLDSDFRTRNVAKGRQLILFLRSQVNHPAS